LIGQRLKKKNPQIKWIADFRDPWSEWGVLHGFNLMNWAKRVHRKMERNILTSADRIITITPFYVKQLERLSGRTVDLITNGFDEIDFESFHVQSTEKFIIRHVGLVNPTCDPRPFMKAVEEVVLEHSLSDKMEIVFTGQVNDDFKQFVLSNQTLKTITRFQQSVPHAELVKLFGASSALLLILTGYKDGEGFLPGKLFEYLVTNLPIIAVGPLPSDADVLMKDLKVGQMIASEDHEAIKVRIRTLYNNWKSGTLRQIISNANNYSRKQLTFKLSEILKSL
jgi:glycosyltransferase involved in cell wall biosynthesis